MATYGDNPAEYPYSPPKKKKQKYSLQTRIIDFTNNLPITSGVWGGSGNATTAWALNDVLQVMRIRAGQTVLTIQVEILTYSADSGDHIDIGYGDDPARWGTVNLYQGASPGSKTRTMQKHQDELVMLKNDNFLEKALGMFDAPFYFASGDSIDITIGKAALVGKVRIIVHLLEDDR